MGLTKEEKAALREKLTMKNQQGQDLWRKPGEIDGKQFVIFDLEDCNVHVLDHTAQVSFESCQFFSTLSPEGLSKDFIFVYNHINFENEPILVFG
jgi:hypothetical protein